MTDLMRVAHNVASYLMFGSLALFSFFGGTCNAADEARRFIETLVHIRAAPENSPNQYGTGFVYQLSRESALILTAGARRYR